MLRGVTTGERGVQFPVRRITAGSSKSPKHFSQYSTFASERPQVRTWGRQTCFLPRAPSNLVTSLNMLDFNVQYMLDLIEIRLEKINCWA